jgi:hypothetical protein
MITNQFSTITEEELKHQSDRLTAQAEGVRQNVLKQCDQLESLYKEILKLRTELTNRIK